MLSSSTNHGPTLSLEDTWIYPEPRPGAAAYDILESVNFLVAVKRGMVHMNLIVGLTAPSKRAPPVGVLTARRLMAQNWTVVDWESFQPQ